MGSRKWSVPRLCRRQKGSTVRGWRPGEEKACSPAWRTEGLEGPSPKAESRYMSAAYPRAPECQNQVSRARERRLDRLRSQRRPSSAPADAAEQARSRIRSGTAGKRKLTERLSEACEIASRLPRTVTVLQRMEMECGGWSIVYTARSPVSRVFVFMVETDEGRPRAPRAREL